ncbi:hypothetical protein C0J52_26493, partial [Blattella germanica]
LSLSTKVKNFETSRRTPYFFATFFNKTANAPFLQKSRLHHFGHPLRLMNKIVVLERERYEADLCHLGPTEPSLVFSKENVTKTEHLAQRERNEADLYHLGPTEPSLVFSKVNVTKTEHLAQEKVNEVQDVHEIFNLTHPVNDIPFIAIDEIEVPTSIKIAPEILYPFPECIPAIFFINMKNLNETIVIEEEKKSSHFLQMSTAEATDRSKKSLGLYRHLRVCVFGTVTFNAFFVRKRNGDSPPPAYSSSNLEEEKELTFLFQKNECFFFDKTDYCKVLYKAKERFDAEKKFQKIEEKCDLSLGASSVTLPQAIRNNNVQSCQEVGDSRKNSWASDLDNKIYIFKIFPLSGRGPQEDGSFPLSPPELVAANSNWKPHTTFSQGTGVSPLSQLTCFNINNFDLRNQKGLGVNVGGLAPQTLSRDEFINEWISTSNVGGLGLSPRSNFHSYLNIVTQSSKKTEHVELTKKVTHEEEKKSPAMTSLFFIVVLLLLLEKCEHVT